MPRSYAIVGIVVLFAASANADLIDAPLVLVESSSDLGGPPLRPIEYQPVADYAAIQDGLTDTGINIVGGERVWNPTGDADSGGALRLTFETPTLAQELHLEIRLRSYVPSTFHLYPTRWTLLGLDLNQDLHAVQMDESTNDDTLHFVGSFGASGNSFNYAPDVTIEQIRQPGNRLRITLWGPYMASIHDEGAQGLIVYEARAWYVPVPEPTTLALLAVGAFCARRRGPGVMYCTRLRKAV